MGRPKDAEGFKLQFSPFSITELVERYGPQGDTAALAAGQRIANGDYTRESIETIFNWKTGGRGISRLRRNSDSEIADALRLAVGAATERAAIAVLLGLRGVEVPVASAILTAIYPMRYTVIDFRALESLGRLSTNRSVNFYLDYLTACREIAKAHGATLRDLDRALWQWSRER